MTAAPPPDGAALRVGHLVKTYGEVEAVCGVSFEVNPGEIIGLLGLNGAGKTSVIECIAGLREPDEGEVRIGGIDALVERRRANRRLGIALQATGLQDQITPREALRLFAALHGIRADVDALLARFGLEEKADAWFGQLSGGQRQRLALALAFVNDPVLLILDEPTVGLDPGLRAELHERIVRMRGEGRAVLMATHDMPEAEALCDRLLVIDRGRLVAQGTPQELIGTSTKGAVLNVQASAPPSSTAPTGPDLTLLSSAGCDLRFSSPDLTRGLGAVLDWLGGQDLLVRDIRVSRPTLADVVMRLAGQ